MPTKIEIIGRERVWLIKHYKHTKNDDIMVKLGLSLSTLHRIAKELGLKKSRQFMKQCQANTTRAAWIANRRNHWPPKGYQIPNAPRFQKGVTPEMRLGKKRNEERIRKAVESRRATLASERRRVLFGLPQRTKLKIGFSRKKVCYRHALRKRGYIIDRGASDAYVIEATQRNIAVEQRAAKHGIHIIIQSDNRDELQRQINP